MRRWHVSAVVAVLLLIAGGHSLTNNKWARR